MNWREIETIRVDGLDYKLVFIPQDTAVMDGYLGSVDYTSQRIKILETTERHEIQTLWHELTHLIDSNRLGGVLSETQVNTIGCSVMQILADNPDLLLAMYLLLSGIEFEPEPEPEPVKKQRKKKGTE